MELNLQPLASVCALTGRPFQKDEPVVSYLVRDADGGMLRHDLAADADARFTPPGFVLCRWTHPYKARPEGENHERALKLTAENLFVTLADPANEPNPANTGLIQFLALMLERKKLLRPRGRTSDGACNLYEHARTHQMYEVPAGDLTPEFFVKIQEQLTVLTGPVKTKPAAPPPAPETVPAPS